MLSWSVDINNEYGIKMFSIRARCNSVHFACCCYCLLRIFCSYLPFPNSSSTVHFAKSFFLPSIQNTLRFSNNSIRQTEANVITNYAENNFLPSNSTTLKSAISVLLCSNG